MSAADLLPWLNLLVLPVLWWVLRFVVHVEKRLVRLETKLAEVAADTASHSESLPNLAQQTMRVGMRVSVLSRNLNHLARQVGAAQAPDSGLTEPGTL